MLGNVYFEQGTLVSVKQSILNHLKQETFKSEEHCLLL